ncbi:MAG: nitroreductase family protein [Paludibacter sp.]|nr:nitroreductase family protein [Bacteroidales bacterium]MCM1068929.1 nitroreductase family protein [Prevotella sp.]MCM1353190.1 nitroreductase family protein [Bacteroides sp.]MCM1442512.1 nitroreductase family protein [Muribaculum sp.]MCM1481355.1 nitroreductase family protein [Paludibacter sp.]
MDSFNQLALHRRSIRQYADRPIEQEKVQALLEAALAAPSSKHLNPWEFVVIDDREILSTLAQCRTYGSQMLKQSALGIAVCVDASKTDTWQCDGAIAACHLLLCAEDLGLGGCWVQVYNREGAEELVRRLCNIPENMNVLCIVSVGYKAEDKKPINPSKLQYDKIHYGQYKARKQE